jgi:hypothetical protein
MQAVWQVSHAAARLDDRVLERADPRLEEYCSRD